MTAGTSIVRLLPHAVPTEAERTALAARLGWRGEEHYTSAAGSERVWDVGGSNAARWIDDDVIGLSYLQITGPGAERSAREAAAHISPFGVDELLASLAATDDAERLSALVRGLGVVAAPDDPAPAVSDAFRRCFAHPSALVRLAAALAFVYPGWLMLEPELTALTADRDPDVAATASRTLAALRANRWRNAT